MPTGYGRATNLQECVHDFIRDSLAIEGRVLTEPGEPSRVDLWMAYPSNSHQPWHYMLPTRQSIVGIVLRDVPRPELLSLEGAPLAALTGDAEPMPRRRRVLPATFV